MTLSLVGLGSVQRCLVACVSLGAFLLVSGGSQAQSSAPTIVDGQRVIQDKAAQASPGQQATTAATPPIGRYTMTPAQGGFLRLDTRTGAVSLCSVTNGAVTCTLSADERAAMQAEISRLAQQNAKLETDLRTATKSTTQRLKEILPTDKDMDKALTYAEKFMRRMMRIMREDEKPGERI